MIFGAQQAVGLKVGLLKLAVPSENERETMWSKTSWLLEV